MNLEMPSILDRLEGYDSEVTRLLDSAEVKVGHDDELDKAATVSNAKECLIGDYSIALIRKEQYVILNEKYFDENYQGILRDVILKCKDKCHHPDSWKDGRTWTDKNHDALRCLYHETVHLISSYLSPFKHDEEKSEGLATFYGYFAYNYFLAREVVAPKMIKQAKKKGFEFTEKDVEKIAAKATKNMLEDLSSENENCPYRAATEALTFASDYGLSPEDLVFSTYVCPEEKFKLLGHGAWFGTFIDRLRGRIKKGIADLKAREEEKP